MEFFRILWDVKTKKCKCGKDAMFVGEEIKDNQVIEYHYCSECKREAVTLVEKIRNPRKSEKDSNAT